MGVGRLLETFLNGGGGSLGGKRSQHRSSEEERSLDFESDFTDAKLKVRGAPRGQGKKERRKKSTRGAKRGPKKVNRILSAMDQ